MSDDLNPHTPPPPPESHAPNTTPFGYRPPAYPAGFPQPYAYPPRKPRAAWFWPVIILGIVLIFGLCIWGAVYSVFHSSDETTSGGFSTGDRIAVIDISGVIIDADKINTQLRKFGDDSSVKAIILHIDSPGGGAAASQEIFHEVVRVRQEKHKKIVASVESVGASGAYYIAAGCDQIYANEASVVGSIGVIMEWTNYGDLYRWAKLKSVVIHAGELKDSGDPHPRHDP